MVENGLRTATFARQPFDTNRCPPGGNDRSRRCPFASEQPAGDGVPIFVDKIPAGYRDWSLTSVVHEEGNFKSLGAILGNDVAIKAFRQVTGAVYRDLVD